MIPDVRPWLKLLERFVVAAERSSDALVRIADRIDREPVDESQELAGAEPAAS